MICYIAAPCCRSTSTTTSYFLGIFFGIFTVPDMLYSRTLLQVHIYHHFINNTFRVVGRKLQDHEVRPDQSTKFETFFASEDQQNFALDV